MDDAFKMAIGNASQHLVKILFDFDGFQKLGPEVFDLFPEIFVHMFKDEIQLLLIDDHIFEPKAKGLHT